VFRGHELSVSCMSPYEVADAVDAIEAMVVSWRVDKLLWPVTMWPTEGHPSAGTVSSDTWLSNRVSRTRTSALEKVGTWSAFSKCSAEQSFSFLGQHRTVMSQRRPGWASQDWPEWWPPPCMPRAARPGGPGGPGALGAHAAGRSA